MPLTMSDDRPASEWVSPRTVAAGKEVTKPYIAIVDDDAAFAAYLRTFLSLRGYDARCYSRGDELLAAMKQGELPDAVLLDVMMPGLDGMATLRAIKASRSEAQVIMLSGRNQASTIVEAVQAGATDYVVKPDDPEGLGEIALDVAIKNAIEKNRLVSELSELRQQLSDNEDQAVWGTSDGMRRITTVIEQVGDSDVAVLIRGESGVGKELVSRAIHQQSTRRQRPFVKVNCAALPADLLESELFGHEKGAFTGAATTRIGKFEQADGGTLMLDEIGELTPALQAKLLHVLQDAEFTKLGSNKRVEVDVRIVAATNRDLETMLLSGGVPRRPLLPPPRHRADGPGAARTARRDSDAHRILHRAVCAEVQANGATDQPATAAALPRVRLAGEHPRAGEHHQAARHPPGRADRHRRDRAEHAAGRGRAVRAAVAPSSVAPGTVEAAWRLGRRRPPRRPANRRRAAPSNPPWPPGVPWRRWRRAAAMKAERALIDKTLNQVHWNRRKASQILEVSYKTLLNKIKECGITRD